MSKNLFVTGTGTDVGKTYVTALLVKKLRDCGLKAGYYKAAISGADVAADGQLLPGDALYVNDVAGLNEETSRLVSYVYPEAVSPHLAAQINRAPMDMNRIEADFNRAAQRWDYLTMEGSGGIVCPLRWDDDVKFGLDDVVKRLGLPVIIVAAAGLGTINATVLTVEHLRAATIPVRGIILNRFHAGDVMEEDNRRMIEALTKVPVVAVVKDGDTDLDIDIAALTALYE